MDLQSPRSSVDHFHQGDPDSPTLIRDHDLELDHGHHHRKLSVLARVKEKARKWRQTLTRNKQRDQNSTTPEWGVTLEEDDESGEEKEEEEEDQEQVGDDKNALLNKQDNMEQPKVDILVIEKPNAIDSTGIPTDSPANASEQEVEEKGGPVKEYLMQKFEPGENERALSQMISETMSRSGDVGVVEKVKQAVVSLLASNQSSSPAVHSPIPISTNPHEDVEEESHGRRLQMN